MVKLTLETAKQLYKEGGAGKSFALDNYSETKLIEKELAKSWEELKSVQGYFISNQQGIQKTGDDCDAISENENIFRTEKQAKSALAMAMLSQLMAEANKGWEPDWENGEVKYIIKREENRLSMPTYLSSYYFLAFRDSKTRNEFYNNHKELIKTYFQL